MLEPIRTVIADDEPLARRQLRALLQRDPQISLVAEAGNGQEARAALVQHEPELVLLDIRMPLGDGFSALEGLVPKPYVIFEKVTPFTMRVTFVEQAPPTAITPLVVMSSSGSSYVMRPPPATGGAPHDSSDEAVTVRVPA